MKTHKPLPSLPNLHDHFRISGSGRLIWKLGQRTGKIAGRRKSGGYWWLQFRREEYSCSRIAYAMANGVDPKDRCIDHINGNASDNHPSNLRLADHAQSSRYRIRQRNNTSGVVGVSYHSQSGKWQARVSVGDRRKFLGLFDNKGRAAAVTTAARQAEYGAFFRE